MTIKSLHVAHTDKDEPIDNTDFDAAAIYDVRVGEAITIPARIFIDPETRRPEEPTAFCRIDRVYNKDPEHLAVSFTIGNDMVTVTGLKMTSLRPAEVHVIDEVSEPAAVVFHIRVRPQPRKKEV